MKQRGLRISTSICMLLSFLVFTVIAPAAWAQTVTNVSYRAYNTGTGSFESLTAASAETVTSSTTTMGAANTETWYVVNSNVTVDSRIEVLGTVNLILADGFTLTAPKGLHVSQGVTLNIYGQTAGTGAFSATNVDYNRAAIGSNPGEDGGSVTIHGGNITAISTYDAAGIGGGLSGNGGNVTIRGGIVTATGKTDGAGIGGGSYDDGGIVTITGGTVTATGGADGGAGIGGGYHGAGGSVTISGGTVIAIAGNKLAQAIGRGDGYESTSSGVLTFGDMNMKVYSSADATEPVPSGNRESTCRTAYVKIESCTEHHYVENTCTWCGATRHGVVYGRNHATGGTAPVDPNNYTNGATVTVLGNTGNLERAGYTFSGWNTKADGSGTDYAADGTATFTYDGDVTIYAQWTPIPYTISYDLAGGTLDQSNPTTYTADDEITLNKPTREGYSFGGWTGPGLSGPTLTVIIAPGSTGDRTYTANWSPIIEYRAYNTDNHVFETRTANAYLNVTSSTTSLGEAAETWYVVNNNSTLYYDRIEVTGTVNLILCDGKTLTANKGLHVPSGVTLNIYCQTGGTGKLTIPDYIDYYLAGIGGDKYEDGGTVNIHGGIISTNGGSSGAGIGGGNRSYAGTITINGGTVHAAASSQGAGIGMGQDPSANSTTSFVTITGGVITATSVYGSGIGQGQYPNGKTIAVTMGNAARASFISVTANKVSGTVTIVGDLTDGTTVYHAGAISDTSVLDGKTLTSCVHTESTYNDTESGKQLLINSYHVPKNAALIAAWYDDNGVMLSTDIVSEINTATTVSGSSTANHAKVFVWENLDSLRPLCECETIPFEE